MRCFVELCQKLSEFLSTDLKKVVAYFLPSPSLHFDGYFNFSGALRKAGEEEGGSRLAGQCMWRMHARFEHRRPMLVKPLLPLACMQRHAGDYDRVTGIRTARALPRADFAMALLDVAYFLHRPSFSGVHLRRELGHNELSVETLRRRAARRPYIHCDHLSRLGR